MAALEGQVSRADMSVSVFKGYDMGDRAFTKSSQLAFLLLVVGAALRFAQLDQYPLGVHQDELSEIYDGYSIAETGADRFGSFHPAAVRAFGDNDYRPAMYAWLAAGSIKIFGFSIKAGRIPAAVAGTVSLMVLYLFARLLGGETFALLALLLGVLSPLHIQYSRVAHQGGILPGLFVILILYIWEKASTRGFPLLLAALLGLAVGLSANAYQATRLTALLFAIGIGVSIVRHRQPPLAALLLFCVCAMIGAAPQLVVLAKDPDHFFSRAAVLFVRPDNPLGYPAIVAHNYWLNLAPTYLFVPRRYEALTVARLLPPEIIFFYAGLIGLAALPGARRSHGKRHVYFAAAVAILPAAISLASPHPLRTSGMTVLTPLFSAAGIVWLYSLLPAWISIRRLYLPGVICALVASFALIGYRYSRSIMYREMGFQNFLVQLDSIIGRHAAKYDAVILENYGTERNVYVASFTGMHPREFQRAPKHLYSDGMDYFTRLGKYYFVQQSMMQRAADSLARKPARILFVASSRLRGVHVVDSVKWNGQTAYLMKP